MKERHIRATWEHTEQGNALAVLPPVEISTELREAMISSAIATQALEGLYLSRERAEEIFEEVLREPLPKIGE